MSIANLSHVLKLFRGTDLTPEEENELFREVLLMTLARASSSDANIAPVEVETVQAIVEKSTGREISTADVRVAAASELYETAPLEKYLSSCGRKLDAGKRVATVQALAEVIKSDTKVTSREVDFFDMVAVALAVTPAELAGLIAD
ncbi:MAG: TerB family tellurite resistance protein [Gammaproteobacteria bacterium]|nr:TerB family tellurite resistance protein [Gammaproteobacteria bacterium]